MVKKAKGRAFQVAVPYLMERTPRSLGARPAIRTFAKPRISKTAPGFGDSVVFLLERASEDLFCFAFLSSISWQLGLASNAVFPARASLLSRSRSQASAKPMAEEHRLQTPEGHRLCANNCGFFGSPATLNLCSKCYRDRLLKEEHASSAKIAVEKSLSAEVPATAPNSSLDLTEAVDDPRISLSLPSASSASSSSGSAPAAAPDPNRCSACRKRVGLTGFLCRCGTTFCGTHRYPEQHGCSFDFKAVGREEIARANPVVKARKLDRI